MTICFALESRNGWFTIINYVLTFSKTSSVVDNAILDDIQVIEPEISADNKELYQVMFFLEDFDSCLLNVVL